MANHSLRSRGWARLLAISNPHKVQFWKVRIISPIYRWINGLREVKRYKIPQHVFHSAGMWTDLRQQGWALGAPSIPRVWKLRGLHVPSPGLASLQRGQWGQTCTPACLSENSHSSLRSPPLTHWWQWSHCRSLNTGHLQCQGLHASGIGPPLLPWRSAAFLCLISNLGEGAQKQTGAGTHIYFSTPHPLTSWTAGGLGCHQASTPQVWISQSESWEVLLNWVLEETCSGGRQS